MGDFSPAEKQTNLNFVSFFEEFARPLDLDFEIVQADLEAEFDRLDFNLALILFGLGQLLTLFVFELAPVDDADYGRGSVGSDFC